MSDDADLAAERLDVEVAARLSLVDAAIPAGVPGECDECGETMPRLVAGRCGYCRDGRRPPLSTFDRLAPPVAAPVALRTGVKEEPVPGFKDRKYVSVPCEKRVLCVIEQRAKTHDVSLGVAALDLIEAGIRALDAPVAEPALATITVVSLEKVPADWLTDELHRRLAAAADPALLDAEKARADAAEERFTALRSDLLGLAEGKAA